MGAFTGMFPWALIGMSLALMLLDILSGCAKGAYLGTFSSTAMRKGLWHKCGFILAIALGACINVFFGLAGVSETLAEMGVVVPSFEVCQFICVYISVCEITSIWENIRAINDAVPDSPLKKHEA